MSKGRILVVEDDVDISNMLRIFLDSQGYEVMEARRGDDALKMCRDRLPDMIILKAVLPGMDGYQVCRELRLDPHTRHVPIMFLAEKGERSDRIRAFDLGADDYITKPFDLEELRLRIQNMIRYAWSHPAIETSHATGSLLIVEDDFDISNMLRIYFDSQGYEVMVARRGDDALEMCRHSAPGVIVLDVMLPDIDGYEVLRRLRANWSTSHIPILFLTQRDERSDKIVGLELGADDYITKPFNTEELRLRIQNSLRRAVRQGRADAVTRLPGPRVVEDRLTELLFDQDWAVLYIGVNNFHVYKMVYGLPASNQVLRLVAGVLRESVGWRGIRNEFVGRIGGEDFIIITDKNAVESIVESIRDSSDDRLIVHFDRSEELSDMIVHGEGGNGTDGGPMSLSVGVATDDDGPFSDIQEMVDVARARCTEGSLIQGSQDPKSITIKFRET